jgi:hypothetical protein
VVTSVQRHVLGAGPVLLLLLLQHACVSPSRVDLLDTVPDLVLAHVNIVDVDAGRVLRDRTVSIAGRHIVSVLPYADTALPSDVRVIDATGKYLLPGLWDMHSHVSSFGPSALPLYVVHGVTGVRDMGAEQFTAMKAMRDSIAAGLLVGPRMKIASPIVETAGWLAWVKSVEASAGGRWKLYERFGPPTAGAAERWVDSVAALGADHIKVRNWPAVPIGQALVARAHERGLPVVAHANEPFPRTGVASYEHGIWPPLRVSAAGRDSLWHRWAADSVAFTPTLLTWTLRLIPAAVRIDGVANETLTGIDLVPHGVRDEWQHQLRLMTREPPHDWAAVYAAGLRDLHEMRRAGVPILAGTDLGSPLIMPGSGLHDELALLVRDGGLTTRDVLLAATLAPARLLGVADSIGAIAPDFIADLVLLDADPLQDIANIRRIHAVVLGGRYLDRRVLDGMRSAAATAALDSGSRGCMPSCP